LLPEVPLTPTFRGGGARGAGGVPKRKSPTRYGGGDSHSSKKTGHRRDFGVGCGEGGLGKSWGKGFAEKFNVNGEEVEEKKNGNWNGKGIEWGGSWSKGKWGEVKSPLRLHFFSVVGSVDRHGADQKEKKSFRGGKKELDGSWGMGRAD